MELTDFRKLRFRRQYLLVPEEIDCPFSHTKWNLAEKYSLYAHTDLVINRYKDSTDQLVLLGDMFDYEYPLKNNVDILKDLISKPLDVILEDTAKYSGKYVLIIIKNGDIYLAHDSTANRKIYYCNKDNSPWFGSQPHLLAKVMGYPLSRDPSRQEYYSSDDFIRLNNTHLGNTTCYNEINQVMPNHYLDLGKNQIIRYWPAKCIESNDCFEAAEKCSVMIKGFMESISNRYKVMLPVTAGADSRLLMAATREFREKVLYYINMDKHLTEKSTDIKVPKRLFQKLSMEFNLVELPEEVDSFFELAFNENNPIASKKYLPHIYNYYRKYSDRVNLPGHIASAPWGINQFEKQTVTIDELVKFYGVYKKYDHAEAYYQQWMETSRQLCEDCNLSVINLFYWEERITNWGSQTTLDKDMAQEELNPFNSRLLNELFLSVHPKFNTQPGKRLHQSIITILWPDLMKVPFNPSLKTAVKVLLAQYGLQKLAEKTHYKLTNKKYEKLFLDRSK